ncbi:MAG: divalent-cation tolerance protein CutA [Verrucomicrobiales bacterium]|nr:divalent-cation tolerance protein CutA [Verrucomicrobiales bacterium]
MTSPAPTDLFIVLTTFPDAATARQIGTLLIEQQLAACINVLAPCESIYRWQGAVETSSEVPGIFKTTREAFPALAEALRVAHPYEVPEIIALPVAAGSEDYLAWVVKQCPKQHPMPDQ